MQGSISAPPTTIIITSQLSDEARMALPCEDASFALATNTPCLNAITSIKKTTLANTGNLTGTGQLYTYCSENCLDISRKLRDCRVGSNGSAGSGEVGDGTGILGNADIDQLYCTTSSGLSCYNVIVRMMMDMEDLLTLVYQECANKMRLESIANQTACSQDCAVVVQVFKSNITSSCCYLESLELKKQVGMIYLNLLNLLPRPCHAGNLSALEHTIQCQAIQGRGDSDLTPSLVCII